MKRSIFFEPVNTLEWNLFENVHHIGHIEPFYAVNSMQAGDLVLLHVGTRDRRYKSGIYAYGTIVKAPYIMGPGHLEEEGRLYTDVRIDYMQWNQPIVNTQDEKLFNSMFRAVHKIQPEYYDLIQEMVFDAVEAEEPQIAVSKKAEITDQGSRKFTVIDELPEIEREIRRSKNSGNQTTEEKIDLFISAMQNLIELGYSGEELEKLRLELIELIS